MTLTMPSPADVDAADAIADYDRIRRAIAFLTECRTDQPSTDQVAAAVGMTPVQLTRLFARFAGITPKQFLAAITLDAARRLLDDSASVLDTALEVGLSGPGRLHDLFVTHEAMSPGAYKSRGAGLVMRHGFHPSPFGIAVLVATEHGLAGLAFADPGEEAAALDDLCARWPAARHLRDDAATAPHATRIFDLEAWRPDRPLRLVLIGTDFEIRVWRTLLAIPFGRATTYSTIASHIGAPKASRAVGAAVGRNPLSFVVPCHRVLGRSGDITGYHWGLTRKRAILGWEAGKCWSA
ncbi:methylated-DNA--[protein]-cysteine S-methyltransferase [Siculibacillus lacustris]|uniref:methylated-DNA--[protein]-cysteine S-methyltransferase n=1 Tax=Siculibacillus lacustris TaxID=1549641 RepID=A0A4V2KUD9_9HYPH|nr:bifunctional helix-turn-helix domain-containing protein/methylated-DNA--[protein]-cysteine S-methyltransferase [Siculibacillus lacustris]TBW41235.1 methylated-DNA--[protein]-cysteine S-methyltransferase [Siculibacillus lacustris]